MTSKFGVKMLRCAFLLFSVLYVSASLQGDVQDGSEVKTQQLSNMLAKGKHLNGMCRMHGSSNVFQVQDNSRIASVPSPPLDIRPLVVSGSSKNRVDLVFFSDGYTLEETDKFFADAQRLADDVSQNQTFFTVKPLLNFWGAFTPSQESGVGAGGVPKNTPFGLYRNGTELRAVYYDKPEVAHAACDSMEAQCDFPILLGNDPYYGGLGGEFTVVTSSFLNGPLVLRHELGHSIIGVGEEYDGGFAYFGVNAAHNLSEPVPWSHWLSKPSSGLDQNNANLSRLNPTTSAKHRVERSVMPMQAYPWTLLNTTQAWSIKFISSGIFSRHLVRFSLSGLPEASDLQVLLDGVDLGWVPREDVGLDRWHYDIHRPSSLAGGEHELKFVLINGEKQGVAQLCSAEILEFGDETEFISTPGHYSLYPTYSDQNETSYRPTNEDCLMRAVTIPNFCKVCTEGLWLSLLSRVNLIDNLTESCERHGQSNNWVKSLNLNLIPLAHLRSDNPPDHEVYNIVWERNGHPLPQFNNRTKIQLNNNQAIGNYTVSVKFSTDQVKVDEKSLLTARLEHSVSKRCNSQ